MRVPKSNWDAFDEGKQLGAGKIQINLDQEHTGKNQNWTHFEYSFQNLLFLAVFNFCQIAALKI